MRERWKATVSHSLYSTWRLCSSLLGKEENGEESLRPLSSKFICCFIVGTLNFSRSSDVIVTSQGGKQRELQQRKWKWRKIFRITWWSPSSSGVVGFFNSIKWSPPTCLLAHRAVGQYLTIFGSRPWRKPETREGDQHNFIEFPLQASLVLLVLLQHHAIPSARQCARKAKVLLGNY